MSTRSGPSRLECRECPLAPGEGAREGISVTLPCRNDSRGQRRRSGRGYPRPEPGLLAVRRGRYADRRVSASARKFSTGSAVTSLLNDEAMPPLRVDFGPPRLILCAGLMVAGVAVGLAGARAARPSAGPDTDCAGSCSDDDPYAGSPRRPRPPPPPPPPPPTSATAPATTAPATTAPTGIVVRRTAAAASAAGQGTPGRGVYPAQEEGQEGRQAASEDGAPDGRAAAKAAVRAPTRRPRAGRGRALGAHALSGRPAVGRRRGL